MDRSELSLAIIQQMQAVIGEALESVVPELLTLDLATVEQRVQAMGRAILGQLVERVAAGREQLLPRPVRCTTCGGALRRRERTRSLSGLVGDYQVQRGYYWCKGCGRGQTPLDEALGLGPGGLAPGLARVVARAAVETSFDHAAEQMQETLGVVLSGETVRRTAEQIGAVAEAQTQGALTRAQHGYAPEPDADLDTSVPGTLAVEVDGVQVHRDDGWHEMKVVTVAPLGPDLHTDAHNGRTYLRWGRASYGAGVEGAEDFWWRAYGEARRRGLGTAAVGTVVVLGDGAAWIWQRATAFLGLPGVEVVEIVDIYHAYDYLWAVGNAVFGPGSPRAAAWVEPLKDRLYEQGAAPVLSALARLAPATAEAEEARHAAQSYFTTHAARMDYPRFVARQFPIGSGAVESSCKCLVEARLKQAGMRWVRAGAQAIASLRALQRSGRWAAFWQTHPYRQSPALPPPARPLARPLVPVAPPAAAPPRSAPADRAVLAPPAQTDAPPSSPRPKPAAHQRPLLLPRSA